MFRMLLKSIFRLTSVLLSLQIGLMPLLVHVESHGPDVQSTTSMKSTISRQALSIPLTFEWETKSQSALHWRSILRTVSIATPSFIVLWHIGKWKALASATFLFAMAEINGQHVVSENSMTMSATWRHLGREVSRQIGDQGYGSLDKSRQVRLLRDIVRHPRVAQSPTIIASLIHLAYSVAVLPTKVAIALADAIAVTGDERAGTLLAGWFSREPLRAAIAKILPGIPGGLLALAERRLMGIPVADQQQADALFVKHPTAEVSRLFFQWMHRGGVPNKSLIELLFKIFPNPKGAETQSLLRFVIDRYREHDQTPNSQTMKTLLRMTDEETIDDMLRWSIRFLSHADLGSLIDRALKMRPDAERWLAAALRQEATDVRALAVKRLSERDWRPADWRDEALLSLYGGTPDAILPLSDPDFLALMPLLLGSTPPLTVALIHRMLALEAPESLILLRRIFKDHPNGLSRFLAAIALADQEPDNPAFRRWIAMHALLSDRFPTPVIDALNRLYRQQPLTPAYWQDSLHRLLPVIRLVKDFPEGSPLSNSNVELENPELRLVCRLFIHLLDDPDVDQSVLRATELADRISRDLFPIWQATDSSITAMLGENPYLMAGLATMVVTRNADIFQERSWRLADWARRNPRFFPALIVLQTATGQHISSIYDNQDRIMLIGGGKRPGTLPTTIEMMNRLIQGDLAIDAVGPGLSLHMLLRLYVKIVTILDIETLASVPGMMSLLIWIQTKTGIYTDGLPLYTRIHQPNQGNDQVASLLRFNRTGRAISLLRAHAADPDDSLALELLHLWSTREGSHPQSTPWTFVNQHVVLQAA